MPAHHAESHLPGAAKQQAESEGSHYGSVQYEAA